MKRPLFQQIASKWLKTQVMLSDEALAVYIPETVWWSPDNLCEMLKRYRLVYVKPDKGGGGIGVMRVEAKGGKRFEVRYLTKRQAFLGRQSLISFLNRRLSRDKRYLIQQGIRLARVADRPFDIRVVVQKPDSHWFVAGMAAKVAAKQKIVTNRSSGGFALPVRTALARGLGWSDEQIRETEQQLHWVALRTASTLSKRFTRLRVLGLDVGIDETGTPWIFEVNTRPQFHLFQIIDPKRYRWIMQNQQKIIAAEKRRQSLLHK